MGIRVKRKKDETLKKVEETLLQLKESRRIRDFLIPGNFLYRKREIDFYVVYVNGKYMVRSFSIAKGPGRVKNKSSIYVSRFDGQDAIKRKILESMKKP